MHDEQDAVQGKKILITGHTGFVGSWITKVLLHKGARIYGISLDVPTTPSMFEFERIGSKIYDKRGDVRNLHNLVSALREFSPDVVIHLAAQPLVLNSYKFPLDTFTTNIIGTVNLLEAIKLTPSVKSAVIFTSDKVYRNTEMGSPFVEDDRLGGYDPYSASKSCADIIVTSYRKSFFDNKEVAVSTVRAGNIIGGGDWSQNRLIPDAVRAAISGQAIKVRHPNAIRPWQHILDVVYATLRLISNMQANPVEYSKDYNIGPKDAVPFTVLRLLESFFNAFGSGKIEFVEHEEPEAGMLNLDTSLARRELNWTNAITLQGSVRKTAEWYRSYYSRNSRDDLTMAQVLDYEIRAF